MTANVPCLDLGADCKQTSRENHHESVAAFHQPAKHGVSLALTRYLCGEEFFCHALPFDRSSMTRWRQRMGEERIGALLQESLAVAVKTGAMTPADTRRVIVDTTVQPRM